MPERVTVKTEDLVGIIDYHEQLIHSHADQVRELWREYHTIQSFSEFRALEEAFDLAQITLKKCINAIKDWRTS